jgi:isoleucyl-tRNA synthetase
MSKRLGNADPFDISRVWSRCHKMVHDIECKSLDNLKFDLEGIAEVRRKFFGTLQYYSFFSLYANIDGFKYDEAEIPLKNDLKSINGLFQN